MTNPRDLYQALGVRRDASRDEIRSAYRKLARTHHPDVNPGDVVADERFKEVATAYDVLGDDEKRKLYDEFGEDALAAGFDPERARQHRRWQEQARRSRGGGRYAQGPTAGAPQDWGDLSDFMSGIFGSAQAGPRPGADVEAALDLDFLDAIRGFETTLVLAGEDPTTGQPTRREIRVKVPPGAETGKRIRLRGQGQPGPNGGPPGDLYVVPHVRDHARVTREGRDLIVDLPVTVAEAMAGAKVPVSLPTGGRIEVRVPAGTQSGRRLRVKGKGVPAHGSRSAGDLYLRAMIQVPEGGGADALAAARRLDPAYPGDLRRGMEFR